MWLAPAAVVAWKVLAEPQRKLLVLFTALAGIGLTIARLLE